MDTSDLQTTELEVTALQSINKKLDFLVTPHKIKGLCSILELAPNHIKKLQQSNNSLQTVKKTH